MSILTKPNTGAAVLDSLPPRFLPQLPSLSTPPPYHRKHDPRPNPLHLPIHRRRRHNHANGRPMTEVDHSVEGEDKAHPGILGKQGAMAQASGLFNVAWFGGQVLGPLVAGLLMDVSGWSTMTCAFGIMSGAMAMVISLTDRRILQALVLVGNV
ncbi:uncharacterized protein LDX57_007204 [Aspergillus melleus]|uniref:uncharacterized protein n=1 Tax=Aspergillus melleus TaxID=138277 RepID=UPI001E8CEB8E|nr:uncharacterized protein LDX57_007204 [Aspergillus melleus]KAH8429536.1 hypothetical protein LDX57_007204 [Aspergillus melleus]